MAAQGPTGQVPVDLEPKIRHIWGWTSNDTVTKVDTIFKELRQNLERGHVAWRTSLKRLFEGFGAPSRPEGQPDDGGPDERLRLVKDMVLAHVLTRISTFLTADELKQLLNEKDYGGGPFLSPAVDHHLWRSVEIMLKHGASVSPPTIVDIVQTWDEFPGELDRKRRAVLQYFLDLNSIRFKSEDAAYYLSSLFRGTSFEACGSTDELFYGLLKWPPGFAVSRPSNAWFHVPSSNGLVVAAILKAIGKQEFYDIFAREWRPSLVPPGDLYLNCREHRYWSSRLDREASFPSTVIVFPTMMLTTYGVNENKRDAYTSARDEMSTRTSSTHSKDCLVHMERTLDETYFAGLPRAELRERNTDQIVSRKFKRGDPNAPIVIVPQPWLWQFDNALISAHGVPREQEGFQHHSSILGSPTQAHWSTPKDKSSEGLVTPREKMAWLMAQYITSFGSVGSPPTLDRFEQHIVEVLSKVKNYKEREMYKEEEFQHDLSDCRSELAMIQYIMKQQRDVLTAFQNDVAEGIKATARDLDETQVSFTSYTLVSRLHEILATFPTIPAGYADDDGPRAAIQRAQIRDTNALSVIEEALNTLTGLEERAKKIDGDAERIEKSVQDMLNLRRTYASIQDAQASILLGVAAGTFAIITIIFAPLAFVTALFALDVQGFDSLKRSNDSSATPGNRIDVVNNTVVVIPSPPKEDPVFDAGRLAGILIGSVLVTLLVTLILVFGVMNLFDIDTKSLRLGRKPAEHKESQQAEKRDEITDQRTEKVTTGDARPQAGRNGANQPETAARKTSPRSNATTSSASHSSVSPGLSDETATRMRQPRSDDIEAQ